MHVCAFVHVRECALRAQGGVEASPSQPPSPWVLLPLVSGTAGSGERGASFQLPVTGSGSSDKKMCLFIPKYLNNHQFHVCVGGLAFN
jgi:hypothetical protein